MSADEAPCSTCSLIRRMLLRASTSKPCSQTRAPRELDELFAKVAVAGRDPRLEQGLELPGLTPLAVVAGVALECPAERAQRPLRPQVEVHFERRTVGGRGREDCDQPAGEGECTRPPPRTVIGIGVHQYQVDVRGVVDLIGAPLPHRDHGEREILDNGMPYRSRFPCRCQRGLDDPIQGLRIGGHRRGQFDGSRQVVTGDDTQRPVHLKGDIGLLGVFHQQAGMTGQAPAQDATGAGNRRRPAHSIRIVPQTWGPHR